MTCLRKMEASDIVNAAATLPDRPSVTPEHWDSVDESDFVLSIEERRSIHEDVPPCPVCLDYPLDPRDTGCFQQDPDDASIGRGCIFSYYVCASCISQLGHCPQCGLAINPPYRGITNARARECYNNLEVWCRYSTAPGPRHKVRLGELREHESVCMLRGMFERGVCGMSDLKRWNLGAKELMDMGFTVDLLMTAYSWREIQGAASGNLEVRSMVAALLEMVDREECGMLDLKRWDLGARELLDAGCTVDRLLEEYSWEELKEAGGDTARLMW